VILGQFSYASCGVTGAFGDAGNEWKVKEIAAEPGVRVAVSDVRWAASRLGLYPPVPIPPLASAAVIAALPRTLRLDVRSDGIAALTHRAPAGGDAAGRANSFVHGILLDSGALPLRPIDLAWASEWLEPRGLAEVNAAVLGPAPGTSPLTERPSDVADAWFDERPVARSLLFAAFDFAQREGLPLLLKEDDPHACVLLVNEVQRLITPEAAWRLPFSTFERNGVSGMAAMIAGLAVAAMPRSEAPFLDKVAAVRLDLAASWRRANDAWVSEDGRLPIGAWAALASGVAAYDLIPQASGMLDQLGPHQRADPLQSLAAATLLLKPEETLAKLARGLMEDPLQEER